jgi:large subunit ribosomal protein L17
MLYRNLVTALFKHGRIQTTVPKAKEARSVAEKLITFAKKGDLHSRRLAAKKVNEPAVLQKLFDEIGPQYADRAGGYTRIMRIGPRRGDNAELAILELVDDTPRVKMTDTQKSKRKRRVLEGAAKAAPAAAAVVEEEAAAEETAEASAEETTEEDEEKKED